jgi:hypothetical protein
MNSTKPEALMMDPAHALWLGALKAGPDMPWYYETDDNRAFCKHEPLPRPGMRYRREWPTVGEWVVYLPDTAK